MLRTYERAAMLATKFVGGTYTSRDHRHVVFPQTWRHSRLFALAQPQARRSVGCSSRSRACTRWHLGTAATFLTGVAR
jgi:hypothetical protein